MKVNSIGARGEIVAERFLLRLGHIIIERGYDDGMGEIDLISVDEETVVFTEVKTRTSDSAGLPVESVDENKQQRIVRTALAYLKRNDLMECRSRFDVVAVHWPPQKQTPDITHYQDAFEAAPESH